MRVQLSVKKGKAETTHNWVQYVVRASCCASLPIDSHHLIHNALTYVLTEEEPSSSFMCIFLYIFLSSTTLLHVLILPPPYCPCKIFNWVSAYVSSSINMFYLMFIPAK